MLRVMVVDDEAPARRYLQRLLAVHTDVEVVGEASSRSDAARAIAEMSPDAVFMDIELGDGDGMDLWSVLKRPPLVVFVTAHMERAAHAFEIEAIDYLLKPASAPRLASAIDRLQRAHLQRQAGINPPADTATTSNAVADDVIMVRSQGMTKVIKVNSISAIVAKGDYVELRMAAEKNELMHMTLTRLAERLPSPPFMRLSRSLMLNLDHVANIATGRPLAMHATFSTRAAPVELGRVAAHRLRKIFT